MVCMMTEQTEKRVKRFLPKLISTEMKERRITKKMLAAAMGVHVNTVSEWTLGKRPPAVADLYRVLRYLGHTDEQLAELRLVEFYPLN